MTYQWKGENDLDSLGRAILSSINRWELAKMIDSRGWTQQIHDAVEYAVELGLHDWRMS